VARHSERGDRKAASCGLAGACRRNLCGRFPVRVGAVRWADAGRLEQNQATLVDNEVVLDT